MTAQAEKAVLAILATCLSDAMNEFNRRD